MSPLIRKKLEVIYYIENYDKCVSLESFLKHHKYTDYEIECRYDILLNRLENQRKGECHYDRKNRKKFKRS